MMARAHEHEHVWKLARCAPDHHSFKPRRTLTLAQLETLDALAQLWTPTELLQAFGYRPLTQPTATRNTGG